MINAAKRLAVAAAFMGAMLAPAAAAPLQLSAEEYGQMAERLQLTPEQQGTIEPIVRKSNAVRSSTFQKYGVDLQTCKRPGALGLIRLNKDMNKINADTRSRLAKILTPAQLREYDKIVAEQTAVVKAKIMC